MNKLELLVAKHSKLAFPVSAEAGDLSTLDEWIGDLAERDGGIIGRIHSRTLSLEHLERLKKFESELESIMPRSGEVELFAYCKKYVASLVDCATEALTSFNTKIK